MNTLHRVFLLLIILLSLACRREERVFSNATNLRFSTDTVYLDTVFTTVGSSTYTLKVYNPEKENVIIDNIRLGRGNASAFRINVDGRATRSINNVEILAEDSIYIFVEVTAPEINGADFLYTDSILFNNKGKVQDVNLVTLARDVHFHKPNRFLVIGDPPNAVSIPYSLVDCSQNWTNDKPHVVYGYAIVDTACVLTIEPGTEVYFHNNSGLLVADYGELNVAQNGIAGISDSVIFAGDRLEPFYENVPGQWGGVLGGIYVAQRGRARINLATIKNATTALRIDSAANPQQVEITNSYILNSSRIGIYGGYGQLDAKNVVVANSGLHCFYAFGGNYQFRHCTFANYWNQSTRNTPAVLLANFIEFQEQSGAIRRIVRDVESCYFGNCIVDGNNNQEFSLAEDKSGSLNFLLNNVLLKTDTDPNERGYNVNDPVYFQNLVINRTAGFVDPETNFYDLNNSSQAINQGNTTDGQSIGNDILGRIRNVGLPDLGAYENQEG
jgi:hypothetical protein